MDKGNSSPLYKNVIFDCDSTLSSIEGVDYLAKLAGKEDEVSKLTNMAMNGEIKFEDVFAKRLEIINPTQKMLRSVGEEYIETAVPDAKNTIRALQKNGVDVFIISGGYTTPVKELAKYLGVKEKNTFAVDMHFDTDGRYKGYDKANPLASSGGKYKLTKKLIGNGKSIFVGDSVTDLEAKPLVDLFVGFGGVVEREKVKQESDVYITTNSFAYLLNLCLPGQIQGLSKLGVVFN